MHHSDFLSFPQMFLPVWGLQRACAIFTGHVSVGLVALMVAWACSLGDELDSFENCPGIYSDAPPSTFAECFLLDCTQIL